MSLRTLFLRSPFRQRALLNFVPIVTQRNNYYDYRGRREKIKKNAKYFIAAATVYGASSADDNDNQDGDQIEPGVAKPDLPTFRASEVMQHNTTESCWVIFKAGVYDVTEFIAGHPGGEQILDAAGSSIEPFWNTLRQHHRPEVYEILEELRIGNLHEDDIVEYTVDEDLWKREPLRNPNLRVLVERPFNAETPGKILVKSLDTPNELFFVRHHMPVPAIDGDNHKVEVTVCAAEECGCASGSHRAFSLRDLAARKQHSVRAALMCAGNRRNELKKIRKVKGLDWTVGGISNACWTGPLLREILIEQGVDPENTEGFHVTFVGEDEDANGEKFSTSIPLSMAMNPNQRIVLALRMNNEELPADHGYPVRVVVPGAIAVRSVKWLKSIIVSRNESSSHFHKKDYRSFNPSTEWETADFENAPPIYGAPVTSAICVPTEGASIKPSEGLITVQGYAYSGSGNRIVRVDVSADGGRTWTAAQGLTQDTAPASRHYSWALWTARVPAPRDPHPANSTHTKKENEEKDPGEVELVVRATDSSHNTQPESARDLWNLRGLLCNSYHRVKVKIQQ